MSKKRKAEVDPTKLSDSEYADWARGKTDEEIAEYFPGMRVPPRPQVGETTPRERELAILASLPRPPERMHQCTDAEVRDWLKACADVSAEGIRTAFAAHNWPGSLRQRLDVWGRYAEFEKEAQAREESNKRKAQEEMRDKAVAAEKRQLAKIGWAQ